MPVPSRPVPAIYEMKRLAAYSTAHMNDDVLRPTICPAPIALNKATLLSVQRTVEEYCKVGHPVAVFVRNGMVCFDFLLTPSA